MRLFTLLKRLVYRLRGEYTVDQLVDMGLKIGKNFNPQLGVSLDPSHCWLIEIGDDVTIAPHAQILAHDASTCNLTGYARIGNVRIGNRVFIGAGAIVLPNTEIGDDVIVGAGSVVSHVIPSGVVCAGVPAKPLCSIKEFQARHMENMNSMPVYGEEYTLRGNISPERKQEQWQAVKAAGGGYVK